MDQTHGVTHTRFELDGVLTVRGDVSRSPTFAGVLAFPQLALFGGPEPVLYPHPRFTGTLPAGLLDLAQRRFDAGTQSILTIPSKRTVLDHLGFQDIVSAVNDEEDQEIAN